MTELNSPPPDDAPLEERKRYAREVLAVGKMVNDPAVLAYGRKLMAAVRREEDARAEETLTRLRRKQTAQEP